MLYIVTDCMSDSLHAAKWWCGINRPIDFCLWKLFVYTLYLNTNSYQCPSHLYLLTHITLRRFTHRLILQEKSHRKKILGSSNKTNCNLLGLCLLSSWEITLNTPKVIYFHPDGLLFQHSPTSYVTYNAFHQRSCRLCGVCMYKVACGLIKISPSNRVCDVHCSTHISVCVGVCQRLSVNNNK